MNDLDLLRPTLAFAAVVETGSFRAAAERLGLSPPYVSQMIADLEARLGRQLLYRSTRKIALTAAGEAYLMHAQAMARSFRDGVDAVRDRRSHLTGRLAISAPTVLSSPFFARVLADFTARHPALEVEIQLDDRSVDPVDARVDLALRIGEAGDDPRLSRLLFTTRGVVCCGPAAAPGLQDTGSLRACTLLRSPRTSPVLHLTGPGDVRVSIEPEVQIVVNNATLIRAMLAEGVGVALMPAFAVREALERGDLGLAVAGWGVPDVPVRALFTERRTSLANARAFVDTLIAAQGARKDPVPDARK